jgi:signal transduction histidine kinase/CheY-like chemotaxis protein/HPt (histidine-containing phosphotransfer) domain-containing protein
VKKSSLQIKIGLLMILAVFLLLATGYLSYRNLSSVVSSIRIDYQPERTLMNIREMSTDLEQAENSFRRYMITERRRDLQPYYNVISGIDEKVNKLRQELINDSLVLAQVDTISDLIEENIYIWNELLYLNNNDTVNDYLGQLSERLSVSEASQKEDRGILRRVFSRSNKNQMDSEGLINDLQKIEKQDRITEERMMDREYQLAITSSKIREQFYALITKMEREIYGLIDEKASAAKMLAAKTYRWLAMFSVSGTLLAILVLFIVTRYVRKTFAYQVALEHSKAEAEKLARTKEIFMANMSHEIRTPVTAISGFTEQLMHEPLNKNASRIVRIIKSSSDHLVRIIDDILDFSRLQHDKMVLEKVHFRIDDILEDVYSLFEKQAAKNNTDLSYTLGPDTPGVLLGDPYRLKQIMINLVSNAIKFTSDGRVHFEARGNENQSGGVDLVIEITDTGIGIEESRIKSIFEDFTQGDVSTTRKYGGTGLGLSIVKKLVALHQGSIECQSRKNEGTRITCSLPYMIGDEKQVSEDVMTDLAAPGRIRKLKILVVDDEEYNRLLFKTILNRLDMEYHEAVNGIEALEMVKNNSYDMLFMDVRMPGIDGLKVTRFIREELKIKESDMPIICISAVSVQRDWPKYEKAGMNTFLPKPFTERMLLNTILSLTGTGPPMGVDESIGGEKDQPSINKKTDLRSLYHIADGDEHFVKQMLLTFIETTDKGLKAIQEAFASRQWESAADAAHKTVPPCRHIGAADLVNILREIEDKARKKAGAGILDALIDDAFSEFETICIVLNEHIVDMSRVSKDIAR